LNFCEIVRFSTRNNENNKTKKKITVKVPFPKTYLKFFEISKKKKKKKVNWIGIYQITNQVTITWEFVIPGLITGSECQITKQVTITSEIPTVINFFEILI
jgi:hypothetical protein